MMRLVSGRVRRPALFRPIINSTDPARPDHDIELLLKTFHLDMPYEETYACSLEDALDLINAGKSDELMDRILVAFKKLEAKYDFILCEGTDFMGKDSTFEYNLNGDIAANIGASVLLVTSAQGRSVSEAQSAVLSGIELMKAKGVHVVAVIANMSTLSDAESRELISRFAPQRRGGRRAACGGLHRHPPAAVLCHSRLPRLGSPVCRMSQPGCTPRCCMVRNILTI